MFKDVKLLCFTSILLSLLVVSGPAAAYIGPGVGLGAIAIVIAVVVGFLLLAVGFLWFPLKRMLKAKREAKSEGPNRSNQ